MFEDYIQDSYTFYTLALEKQNKLEEREAKMFYRASIFCAASALEAFVNFIGDTIKKGDTLDRIEIAYLNDKVLEISVPKAKIEEKIKFNAVDAKIKFIIKKFSVPIDLSNSADWSNFNNFKDLRNDLIHPKSQSDERTLVDYQNSIKKGLNSNIEIMNLISNKIFNKQLRKGLLELKI
ncbi:hypothetical protein [Flavobacterium sp. CLA17]|uniref:hypothetical protein n=1 Tax=Flavobacterium sp. CLA17 TaxID=2724135 RepID=UPI0014926F75|nr:hypothetical protein [Flavobacterium sp. CLA17]QSB27676.1 hypothetical protein HAV12_002715 [Flavobacterium sp. CLA17]